MRGLTQTRIKPGVTRLSFALAQDATIFDGGFDDDGKTLSLTLKPVTGRYTQASFAGRSTSSRSISSASPPIR